MTTSATRSATGSPATGTAQPAGAWLSRLDALVEGWGARLASTDPVLLRHPDGSRSLWQGGKRLEGSPAGKPPAFVAVEIPDDLLLHRSLDLPRLSQSDAAQAVLLEVQGNSPFVPEDLAWGFTLRDLDGGRRRADIVIASRSQLAAFMEKTWPDLHVAGVIPEAWALSGSQAPVVIGGFGEQNRIRHGAARSRWDLALLVLAALLALLAAMTPTMQLRLQAVEAVKASESLMARVGPLVRKRDEVAALNESLRLLDSAAADRVDAAAVMEHLTNVLPDDTHLYSLDIKKAKITAAGHTVDAAALLQRLSSDPRLKDVRAPTAVTRAPGAAKEAFMVEFTMAPSPAPTAAMAAPAMPLSSAEPAANPPTPPTTAAAATTAPAAPTPAAAPTASRPAPAQPGKSPFAIGGSVR
jgi:general secretion pathway protein L